MSDKVFVVYGRNARIRSAMFQFLRAIGLHPFEWGQSITLAKKGSPYIGEVLDTAFAEARAIVVLLTGDDLAVLRREFCTTDDPAYETEPTPQARPNVIFEAGMAFGIHPERTVIVEIGKVRPFSDVVGRSAIRLTNSSQSRQMLAQRLKDAGCSLDLTGTDWHTVGNFDPAPRPDPIDVLAILPETSDADESTPARDPTNISAVLNNAVYTEILVLLARQGGQLLSNVQFHLRLTFGFSTTRAEVLSQDAITTLIELHYIAPDNAHVYHITSQGKSFLVHHSLI